MIRTIVLLMLCILQASCASLSTQGEKVLVTSSLKRIEGCKFIGQVESSSIWIDFRANGVAYNHARNELMNEARKLGANVVIALSNSDTTGEAYKCNSTTY